MDLVNELQISAESEDVLTVMRKAKRLAVKLGVSTIDNWLKAEMDGYPLDMEVPDYRKVDGTIVMQTNGIVPAGFGQLMNGVLPMNFQAESELRDSMPHLMEAIAGDGALTVPLTNEKALDILRQMVDSNYRYQVTFLKRLNIAGVKAIPEGVKNRILDWALELEKNGVIGEGMSFKESEKQTAQSIQYNFFESHIEQVNNSGINKKGQP